MDSIEQLAEWVNESEKMVFFGGAGVSTESGIPDFRSENGLYNQQYKYPPETILSHSFFLNHTEEFYRFYRDKMLMPDVKPNDAHKTLAKWENMGKLACVITQNIDGLHQIAGSRNVQELHGSVHRNTCMSCGKKYDMEDILGSKGIPRCTCGGIIKPDVVLYGESLDEQTITNSVQAILNADLLIVAGTSLSVYPAAGLIEYYRGRHLVLINRNETPMDMRANLLLHENVGKVLKSADDLL